MHKIVPHTHQQTQGDQGDADERKTGEDNVKTEAQKIADAIVAKKLRGMPSKEDLASYKKWQDDQKSESEKLTEAQKAVEVAKSDAVAKADAMIAAVSAGVKTQHIEDAVILAMARVTEDITIEDAIKTVAKNNHTWAVGVTYLFRFLFSWA